jgi:predicted aspartyl protease
MTKYDCIYVPTEVVEDIGYSLFRNPAQEATDYVSELEEVCKVIVITEDELLDLMQESIEHSYPTLLREKAKKLLDAKLKPL